MAKHYSSLIDIFVFFPIGVFPLIKDEMRPGSKEYQIKHNANMIRAFEELKIPKNKIHLLKSKSVDKRVEEILELIIK